MAGRAAKGTLGTRSLIRLLVRSIQAQGEAGYFLKGFVLCDGRCHKGRAPIAIAIAIAPC